jgi:hypothetical protein
MPEPDYTEYDSSYTSPAAQTSYEYARSPDPSFDNSTSTDPSHQRPIWNTPIPEPVAMEQAVNNTSSSAAEEHSIAAQDQLNDLHNLEKWKATAEQEGAKIGCYSSPRS